MDDFELAQQAQAAAGLATNPYQRLREALHAYAMVAETAATGPPRLSGPALTHHVCHPRRCSFVAVTHDLFVCAASGSQHRCTAQTCKSLEKLADGLVCPISGYSFDSLPLLTDADNHRFGGNAQLAHGAKHKLGHEAPAGDDEGLDCEAEIVAALSEAADTEEKARSAPFSSEVERSLLQRRKDQRQRLRDSHALLELLLFSPERLALNAKTQAHTRDKNSKAVANYMRSATPQTPPAFVNVWQIVACDRRDFKWCLEVPERGSPVHLECLRVCEEACIWWHRFIADNDDRGLPNYTFTGHTLAVLYIFAAGLQQFGQMIIPPSVALQGALPGDEKLQSSFASLATCRFTHHERVCRERILAWMHRHVTKT